LHIETLHTIWRNVIKLIEDSKDEKRLGGAEEVATRDPSPEAVAIVQQEHKLVLEVLAGLSHIQRDVLVLREMEGLSYKDIADVTGTTIGTVMSRLSRARAELRRVLEYRASNRHPSASIRVGSQPDRCSPTGRLRAEEPP
jgi:RNA polymerase sigma factor (sigma-70 family)